MKNKFLPGYAVKWLILILIYNNIAYLGARALTKNRVHYQFGISIDQKIPFVPWTVIIYFGCYLFWAITYALIVRKDKVTSKNFALSEMAGKTICALIFILIPTTMARPVISGTGIWNGIVHFLYATDAPDNLFPSIHCYVSWLCFLGVRHEEKIPSWYKWLAFIMAFLVFISTLTVKQHVLADVFSGMLVAEIVYRLYQTERGLQFAKTNC